MSVKACVLVMLYPPLCLRVFTKAVPDGVNLLPAFSPFMCISFLRAHIYNFEIITPFGDVFSFVPNAIPLNGPFSRAFPLHYATALVCCEDNYKFFTTAQEWRPAPPILYSCYESALNLQPIVLNLRVNHHTSSITVSAKTSINRIFDCRYDLTKVALNRPNVLPSLRVHLLCPIFSFSV